MKADLALRIFFALILAYILSIFYRSFLSVIATPLMADLSIGPAELGALSSAWFITFAIMQFPVGWALDRLGPRLTVTACMAVGAVGAFGFALAPTALLATVSMALLGIGFSPVFMAALYLFARSGAPGAFAGVASLFIGLGSLGNLMGAAPLSRAADAFGWRPTMVGVALLFCLALALAALLLRDPPPARRAEGAADEGVIAGLRAILAIKALWFIAPITFFAYAILVTTRGLWVAPFLAEVNGLGRVAQGNGALVMAIAMTAGAFVFGWVEKRAGGPKPTVLWSTALTGLLFAALALSGHMGGLWAVVLFAAIGLAGFNYAIIMAHARGFFPDHLIGRGMTTMNFLFIAGASAVQVASGWFIAVEREAGLEPAAIFANLHWLFAALLAVSVAIYAKAPARP
ncbi:MAG: MFS transporter [Bosea sp.]|jgi:predicted MFS family arabinose efflux permease|nr:MFS transporter [Bosea sp. (in: a-proteobacteria)]